MSPEKFPASENFPAPPPRPRFLRLVATLTAFVLVGGLAGAYQLGVRARQAPSFTVGGAFVNPGIFPTPGADGRAYPYGNVFDTTTSLAPAPGVAPEVSTGDTAPSSTPAGTAGTPGTATSTTSVDLLTSPRPPATGTYTYAVDGSEAVTAFGSRAYPASATIVVHGDPSIKADELVHDLTLSEQHEEREIIQYSPTGIAFTYEGGEITFGPGTQTSQGFYQPPMVQIPFPLRAGASASGTSPVKDPAGNVSRTEVWTSKVVGQEVIDVLGTPRTTWVVDLQRKTTPGGPEQVDRFRRYWYDPELGTWVQWTERFHAARNMIVAFVYDTEYTAKLTGFRPG